MSHVPQDCPQPSPADKAEALYKDYLAGGPDAAYRSLKNDYDASAGMCNRDQYFQQVAADLQASGHMPNLAIGWLKAEKDHIDAGHDGVITKQDVAQAEKNGGLDAIFGSVVLSQVPSPGDNKTFFDQIAHTKRAWTDSPDGIEDADLRKYSRQMHRAEKHEYNREETANAADPLFRDNSALLNTLDTGANGERNGFISRHEMKKFLKDYKEHPGEGVYTAENAEYVNELLHGEVGRVNDHPFHGFSVDRLERRAGVTSEDIQGPQITPEEAARRDTVPEAVAARKPGDPSEAERAAAAPAPDPCRVGDRSNTDTASADKPIDHCTETQVNLDLRKHIDYVSRVQPGEGYNAVAARLLNIFPDHVRTAEERKAITTLGQEIAKLNGDQSTFHLRTGVVLPVSANFELLMAEDPNFKKAMNDVRDGFLHPIPQQQTEAQQAAQQRQQGDSTLQQAAESLKK